MIKSFADNETHKIWTGIKSRKLPPDIQDTARRKLRMLNNIHNIKELNIPPSNKLEKLFGERKGQYSIRINNQWRICFNWNNNDVYDVEIVDYH